MKIRRLRCTDKEFPDILRHIPAPPKELYILGDLASMMSHPRLAVVGSRKVTPYGKYATTKLTGVAAAQGIVIVSGLALGVDTLAHQAALEVNGSTIAILAGGLDNITPRNNYFLAKKILEKGGVLISEYPPGIPPYKHSFIARNRLISGISDGILLTEAGIQSGALHTANFALEQGKTVMAVPGNIISPMSDGTNNLIRAGAVPITKPEHIFQALGLQEIQAQQMEIFGDNEEQTKILTLLQSGVTAAHDLLNQSKLDTSTFNQTLTMLEITGKIYALGAGQWGLR